MTICTAGQTQIVGEVILVEVPGGQPLPMCVAHAQSSDCGSHLVEDFHGDPRVAEAIERIMRIPCPGPRIIEDDEPVETDEDARAALDRIWAGSGGTPIWNRVEDS